MKPESVLQVVKTMLRTARSAPPDEALRVLEHAWQVLETESMLDLPRARTVRDQVFEQLEASLKTQRLTERLVRLYRQRLTLEDARRNAPTRVRYLCRLADQYVWKGDLETATEAYDEAVSRFQLPAQRPNRFGLLCNVALFLWRQKHFDASRVRFHEALELARQLPRAADRIDVLNDLAALERDAMNTEAAIDCYAESLELLERTTDRALLAQTLYNLAGVHYDRRAYTEALECDQRALEIFTALDDAEGIAMTQSGIGELHELYTLDFTAALTFNLRSLQRCIPLEDGFMRHIEASRWLSTARVFTKSPEHLRHHTIAEFQALLGGFAPDLPLPRRCIERAFELADELANHDLLREIREARALLG